MKPKRWPEWAQKYFKTGPSAPFLDGIRRYRVTYRTRPWDEPLDKWKEWAIEMTVRDVEHAKLRTYQQVRSRQEVEIIKVEEVAAEAPIQTGQSVQTVSHSEFERQKQEALDKTEYERRELLREKGLWIPDA